MTTLRLASDFTLPADAATQTFAILAKRGGDAAAAGELGERRRNDL